MEMIEIRPLKPFIINYRCSRAEADAIDVDMKENKYGVMIKEYVPRRRFVGMIPFERRLNGNEIELLANKWPLPPNIELIPGTERVIEHPAEPTVRVPSELAQELVERGLAELVAVNKGN